MLATMKTILLTLLLATPLLAQEDSLSKRFHEAYVLEVIEGKPAEAAKAYLALLQEEKLPARLRQQTEFRFAITCVLLGRSDEARVRLAKLAADDTLDDGMRAQVEEYRKAITEVGMGTALETTLQQLTMDLAKTMQIPGETYRQFEVLGTAAVPYLRRMLHHNDEEMRGHAMSLLLRMDIPDAIDLWEPARVPASLEFAGYLERHPASRAAYESKVRTLSGKRLSRALSKIPGGYVSSAEFAEWVARQAGLESRAVKLLASVKDGVRTEPIIRAWLWSSNKILAVTAAVQYASWGRREGVTLPPELFAHYCELVSAWKGEPAGFAQYAATVPAAERLKLLDQLVAKAGAHPKSARRILAEGPADRLAYSLDLLVGAELDVYAYRDVLLRWAAIARREGVWSNPAILPRLGYHLRDVVRRLPVKEGVALVKARPLPEQYMMPILGFQRPADVPLIAAALSEIESPYSGYLQELGKSVLSPKADPEYLRAVASLWPGLVRFWPGPSFPAAATAASDQLRWIAPRIPVADARASVTAYFRAVWRQHGNVSSLPLGKLVAVTPSSYSRHVLIPSLPAIAEGAPASVLLGLVNWALLYQERVRDLPAERASFDALTVFVRPQLARLHAYPRLLVKFPDLYPVEEWAAAYAMYEWTNLISNRGTPAPKVIEAATRRVALRPELINEGVVAMIRSGPNFDGRELVLDTIYAKAPPAVLKALAAQNVYASDDAVEKRLLALLADPKADESVLASLCERLVKLAPSERLFPAVRRLLLSDQQLVVMRAVAMAKSLGSEKLIPALAPKLDSMDAKLREAAKQAIDSIFQNRRIKEEIEARLR